MVGLKILLQFLMLVHTSLAWIPQEPTKRIETRLQAGVKVGFLGCGTIASAIARGIATQTDVPIESIAVTKRSEKKSSQLQQDFPSLVSIHEDNQEIVDKSDLVFVCVLPQQTQEVLQSLSFDESRHNLISVVVRMADYRLFSTLFAATS